MRSEKKRSRKAQARRRVPVIARRRGAGSSEGRRRRAKRGRRRKRRVTSAVVETCKSIERMGSKNVCVPIKFARNTFQEVVWKRIYQRKPFDICDFLRTSGKVNLACRI